MSALIAWVCQGVAFDSSRWLTVDGWKWAPGYPRNLALSRRVVWTPVQPSSGGRTLPKELSSDYFLPPPTESHSFVRLSDPFNWRDCPVKRPSYFVMNRFCF